MSKQAQTPLSALSLKQNNFIVPDLSLLTTTTSVNRAFLKVARILSQETKLIHSYISIQQNALNTQAREILAKLTVKLGVSYYSYALVQGRKDYVGSRLLFEPLKKYAVTLLYMLNYAEDDLIDHYAQNALYQAHYLKKHVVEHNGRMPDRSLVALEQGLEKVLNQQSIPIEPHTYTIPSTLKGLAFLENPASTLLQQVHPASELDLILDLESIPEHFQQLRDAGHLCLLVLQSLLIFALEEDLLTPSIEEILRQRQGTLFEWFHKAYLHAGLIKGS